MHPNKNSAVGTICNDVCGTDNLACCCCHGLSTSCPGPRWTWPGTRDPLRVCPLSSHSLFLNRAAVRRHIAASKPCHAAQDGIRQIQMEARSCDIMAGAGGAAGSAPDVLHQPVGDVLVQCYLNPQSSRHISYDTRISINACGVVVRAALQYA